MKHFFRHFHGTAAGCARQYKTVISRRVAKQPDLAVGQVKPSHVHIPNRAPALPLYKYGPALVYKQSNKGLYGGQVIQFGNQISEFKNKARRSWLPNVMRKSIWSETLQKSIRIKLTARVLRTITKEYGLDNYLTKDKSARIKELGPAGWKLRYEILSKRELAKKTQQKKKPVVSEIGGTTYKLSVGRRKLIKELFPLVKNDTVHQLTFKEFNAQYKDTNAEILMEKLGSYGYNLSQVAQPVDMK